MFAALLPITRDASTLREGLTGRAAPLIVLSAVAGTTALVLLLRRRYRIARFSTAAAVAAVLLGWAVAQYPWLLVDAVTIDDAAGAPASLRALLVVAALAGVIVLPALVYLLRLTQSESWTRL